MSEGDAPKSEGGTPPDRLSVNPKSPYYNEELIVRGVRIHLNGVEKVNVEEYCISEGWIRVVTGKTRDRHGRPLTMKIRGKVEPSLEDQKAPENPPA